MASDYDIVQGGVNFMHRTGSRIQTKKELKRLVKEEPQKVMFYATSQAGGPHYRGSLALLPKHLRLVIVGPNPAQERSWYAEVFYDKNGKLKVT